jgi:hypothetical protein
MQLMERMRHDVTITEQGQGMFRWECSCSASSEGGWSSSAAEALTNAEAHVERKDGDRSG